ncbi:hypothetical protein Syun_016743 [Stephania yunnanensis]|uniref:Uncharacterized protein n=1 Tax=Stephania yunnanensis TaxID=152371 RepID=A0AAP0P569_9MAGN
MKTMIQSTLNISNNPFESRHMINPRIMHMEANLLDGIRDIRPGESEILQSPCKTPIQSWIIKNSTSGSTNFRFSVNRSSRRFT